MKEVFIYRAWNNPSAFSQGEEEFVATTEQSFSAAERALDEILAEDWHFENISLHAKAWMLDEK